MIYTSIRCGLLAQESKPKDCLVVSIWFLTFRTSEFSSLIFNGGGRFKQFKERWSNSPTNNQWFTRIWYWSIASVDFQFLHYNIFSPGWERVKRWLLISTEVEKFPCSNSRLSFDIKINYGGFTPRSGNECTAIARKGMLPCQRNIFLKYFVFLSFFLFFGAQIKRI